MQFHIFVVYQQKEAVIFISLCARCRGSRYGSIIFLWADNPQPTLDNVRRSIALLGPIRLR